ncbi:ankyrin repeat domain-containing protein [Iodobacter fluviatilis]|uniref:Ankyrin repeat protein n=1 Tax=Iodobacter fluviatilis TaxID=537 RepID=A0A377Q440_9NEIS|nr:ankyrin repeat domain-containing protein [Iodobacter fluviatilis]TCU90501.1 ankyrin repeat protein [Iodobacter fluviatilis]STQ89528.1 Uroporphyrinogen-III decarboxylase [Iodobacter fluviatilis]
MRKLTQLIITSLAIAFSFSPWLLGWHLIMSFGQENGTLIRAQVQNLESVDVKKMIKIHDYGDLKSDGGFNPLSEVILYSKPDPEWLELIDDLVKSGAIVNEITSLHTPLQTAVYINNTEFIKSLIKHGADVNFPNCDGETPLAWASELGRKEAIIELLSAGASKEHKDKHGKTAINYTKNNEITNLLK